MFEQTFKNIDDILHKDAGCSSELDYTKQSSWLLFLKYLDALEHDKAAEAELEGKTYRFILAEPYRWEAWAAPKNPDGKLDHNAAMTGDDLRDFVNGKLFPCLAGFKQRASGPTGSTAGADCRSWRRVVRGCPGTGRRRPSVAAPGACRGLLRQRWCRWPARRS